MGSKLPLGDIYTGRSGVHSLGEFQLFFGWFCVRIQDTVKYNRNKYVRNLIYISLNKNIIENLFLATYNGLVAEYCDPFGRLVVYTEIIKEDNDDDDQLK